MCSPFHFTCGSYFPIATRSRTDKIAIPTNYSRLSGLLGGHLIRLFRLSCVQLSEVHLGQVALQAVGERAGGAVRTASHTARCGALGSGGAHGDGDLNVVHHDEVLVLLTGGGGGGVGGLGCDLRSSLCIGLCNGKI